MAERKKTGSRSEAARELGKAGGTARAQSLPSERQREIARAGGRAKAQKGHTRKGKKK